MIKILDAAQNINNLEMNVFEILNSQKIKQDMILSQPMEKLIPQEVIELFTSVEQGFQEKNLGKIQSNLSSDFRFGNMNSKQYIKALNQSFLFKHFSSIDFEFLDYIENEMGVLWLMKTDIGYMTNLGYVKNNGKELAFSGPCKIVKENNQWKLQGNPKNTYTGLYQKIIGLEASVSQVNIEKYRSLLPEIFDMPKKPLIYFVFMSNEQVMTPFNPYSLASVQLACEYKGKKGKFCITMPETDRIPVEMGKTFGYPKYVADVINFEYRGDTVTGQVIHGGEKVFSVNFKSDSKSTTFFKRISRKPPLIFIRKLMPWNGEKPIFLIKELPEKKMVLESSLKFYKYGAMYEQFGKAEIDLGQYGLLNGLIPEKVIAPSRLFYFSGDYHLAHTLKDIL